MSEDYDQLKAQYEAIKAKQKEAEADEFLKAAWEDIVYWRAKCDELRSELDKLKSQSPVMWRVRRHYAPEYWIPFLHKPVDALNDLEREVQPLFAAPVQPAPLTDEWLSAKWDELKRPLGSGWQPVIEYGRAIEAAVRTGGEG